MSALDPLLRLPNDGPWMDEFHVSITFENVLEGYPSIERYDAERLHRDLVDRVYSQFSGVRSSSAPIFVIEPEVITEKQGQRHPRRAFAAYFHARAKSTENIIDHGIVIWFQDEISIPTSDTFKDVDWRFMEPFW